MNIIIKTDFIKLDQFLKFAGIAESGGHAKEIIADECCFVNNEVCTIRGKKLVAGDTVKVDDKVFTIVKE
ncbi:MAG: RNA-binding S4 domain-containing protein [Oscillospiraceae bacterium]